MLSNQLLDLYEAGLDLKDVAKNNQSDPFSLAESKRLKLQEISPKLYSHYSKAFQEMKIQIDF